MSTNMLASDTSNKNKKAKLTSAESPTREKKMSSSSPASSYYTPEFCATKYGILHDYEDLCLFRQMPLRRKGKNCAGDDQTEISMYSPFFSITSEKSEDVDDGNEGGKPDPSPLSLSTCSAEEGEVDPSPPSSGWAELDPSLCLLDGLVQHGGHNLTFLHELASNVKTLFDNSKSWIF